MTLRFWLLQGVGWSFFLLLAWIARPTEETVPASLQLLAVVAITVGGLLASLLLRTLYRRPQAAGCRQMGSASCAGWACCHAADGERGCQDQPMQGFYVRIPFGVGPAWGLPRSLHSTSGPMACRPGQRSLDRISGGVSEAA